MLKHYVNDSASGDWIRECVKDETEEATVVLPAIPRDPSIADEVLQMTREEIEDALANEFNERRAA